MNFHMPRQTVGSESGTASPNGDRTAPDFAGLSVRVYRLCLGLLGNEPDAWDAAQESLTRAWSSRERKRAGVSWWVWSGGFAVRVCREMRRPRRTTTGQELADELPDPRSGMGIERTDDRHAALREAIMTLPDRQREIVVLRFLLVESTAETAGVLACPEGTVKSNLHKAVESLRRRLNDRAKVDDELRTV